MTARLSARAATRRGAAVCMLAWLCLAGLLLGVRPATARAAAAAPPPAPQLDASAAALIDAGTGQLLYGMRPTAQVAIASTTKLMTALVALEHVSLRTVFTEPDLYFPAIDSQIGLVPGERMTVHDLLIAMLLPSADDAAEDIAAGVGHGSVARFVAMMNARARELGLTHTHYSTPVGLDTPGNYSSAADLAALARYDLDTQPFFRRVVALPRAVLHSGDETRVVVNRNDLVGRYPWITGVKTGHTLEAGYVLVGSATRNGMSLISVVLGTPSEAERDAATLALLDYGFAAFRSRTPVRAGAIVARVPVRGQPGVTAELLATAGDSHVLPVGARVRTRLVLTRSLTGPLGHDLTGPLARGARAGTLLVLAGGRVLARIPLVLARAIPAPPPGLVLARLAVPITLVSALLLALGAGVAVRFGRRRARGGAAEVRRRT